MVAFWRSVILVGRRSCGEGLVSGWETSQKNYYLVDQGKLDAHAVRDGRRALCSASIGADDDGILVVGDVRLDVPLEERPAVQVVDRDVEESLDWARVSLGPGRRCRMRDGRAGHPKSGPLPHMSVQLETYLEGHANP